MNVIELEKITKTYGTHKAVDDLSLHVPKGSIYGFIGPNGSGKTTTIRMIMNILYPDNGNIRLFGQELIGSRLDGVGYLPEERGLYKKMKVKELIKFHGELKGVKDLDQKADGWLKKFDLSKWADKKVETLSKGMSQKVQFIVTIIDEPDLIILDEPFSGLDPVNAEIIKEVILKLRDKGSTIIFSTHDMSVAEKMCDFIFMIYKGKKVLDGTLSSIQEKFGQDTLRVQTELGVSALEAINGIEKVNDFGQIQEVRMSPETNSQDVLMAIMEKTKVLKFELTSPSLNDIFIRIARPENNEDHE
ncbi:MAG: ATP-binding cassette domain-containing protein [Bacteroidetes bacterium]|jgi:ABC-2 type transport system ATP-binding protein|nr:ATP-binding cassette domain-containing protein [Bacteroidota bacterium]MBT3749687.1 ATP-binding cassette domain-containing protein [Bacteroidota bacterium]MBT4400525.1 ATP-binding cassette domain-containing protein [Bacteroidota bacterium]MBT4412250.1 ATP-binding cassette domain-containing protein [Bacteroidota bacterium]MBT5428108.1 ATP-binding cassette domain-containing protein [Bacteroidota bacterium]